MLLPIKVKFGEKEYSAGPLTCRKAMAWREKLSALTSDLLGEDISEVNVAALSGHMAMMLTRSPEKLIDLICDYGVDITRDEILDSATDEQVLLAFSAIMQSAFPFFSLLGTLMEMQKAPSSLPASKYTN